MRDRAGRVQHMQKALTERNVQLDSVLSRIVSETGQLIVRAIAAGERDGAVVAVPATEREVGRGDHRRKPAGHLA